MLLDHDGHLPVFVDFTNGDVHEVNSARRMELPRDSMVVCDRGYVDFSMLYKWNLSGVDFVTRLKTNATYDIPEYDVKQYPGTVLSDEVIFCVVRKTNIRNVSAKWSSAMWKTIGH